MGIPYNVMRCDVDVCKDETIFIMTIQKNWWKKKGEEKKDNNHINIKPFQVSPLFASVPLRGHVGPIPFGLMGVTSNEKREKEEKMYQMIEEVHSFISKQTIKKD